MNSARFPHRDAVTVRLRTVVAAIDRELSLLPRSAIGDGVAETEPLLRSWAELVELLALGPAPALRQCPICSQIGMRAATRCGYCWSKLSPPAAAADVGPDAPAVG